MADNTAKIAELEAILQSGVTTISVNGTTTSVDLDVIRRQLNELRRTDDNADVSSRKPVVATIDLGSCM